jgi:hypothetical protein
VAACGVRDVRGGAQTRVCQTTEENMEGKTRSGGRDVRVPGGVLSNKDDNQVSVMGKTGKRAGKRRCSPWGPVAKQ